MDKQALNPQKNIAIYYQETIHLGEWNAGVEVRRVCSIEEYEVSQVNA
jgi:hypothetical protein